MEDKDKYLIFGTGSASSVFLNGSSEASFEYISGFVDNDETKWGTTFFNKPIYSPSEIIGLQYKKVVISSYYGATIKKQLLELSIEPQKITSTIRNFSGGNLQQFLYLEKTRNMLKNKTISILSNYCWGVFMYRFLGIEYQSPLIGSLLDREHYARLLRNPKYYFNQTPKIKKDLAQGCVILSIDDVDVYFWHELDTNLIINKWQNRVAKIDYDNLFVQYGYLLDGELDTDILKNIETPYKLSIGNDQSIVYSKDKQIITSEPLDLIKWFNKEL